MEALNEKYTRRRAKYVEKTGNTTIQSEPKGVPAKNEKYIRGVAKNIDKTGNTRI